MSSASIPPKQRNVFLVGDGHHPCQAFVWYAAVDGRIARATHRPRQLKDANEELVGKSLWDVVEDDQKEIIRRLFFNLVNKEPNPIRPNDPFRYFCAKYSQGECWFHHQLELIDQLKFVKYFGAPFVTIKAELLPKEAVDKMDSKPFEALQWFARGLTDLEIAAKMRIASKSARKHIVTMRKMLKLSDDESLYHWCYDHVSFLFGNEPDESDHQFTHRTLSK